MRSEHRFFPCLRTSPLFGWSWVFWPPPVHYVPQQRIVLYNRYTDLQLLEVLQAVEGSLGNHSDPRLRNFPVDTETAAQIIPHQISAIHWQQECIRWWEILRNHWCPILLCFGDGKVSEAMTSYSLMLGIFFSCKKQTVFCTECQYTIPRWHGDDMDIHSCILVNIPTVPEPWPSSRAEQMRTHILPPGSSQYVSWE